MAYLSPSFNKVTLCFLVATIAFAAYWPSLEFDFAYDDFPRIVNNPSMSNEWSGATGLFYEFFLPSFPGDLYRPVSEMSFRIQHLMHGDSAFWFHFTNLILHALTSVVVLLFLVSLGLRTITSSFAATLFALHPIHIEAVANISGRPELLAGLLGIGSLLTFMAAIRKTGFSWSLAFSAGLFSLGILSKESCITLLLIFPLLCLRSGVSTANSMLARIWPHCVAALLYLLLRFYVLRDAFLHKSLELYWAENPFLHLEFGERILPSLKVLGDYLLLLLLPLGLKTEYSLTRADFLSSIWSLSGLLSACLFLTWCTLSWIYRKKLLGFWMAWVPLTFLVSANLIVPIGTLMGERLAYLPSLGVCALIALLPNVRLAAITTVLIASFYLVILQHRLPYWRDNLSLFQQMVIDAPRSPKAWENLAKTTFRDQGDLKTAEIASKRALMLDPQRIGAMKIVIQVTALEGRLQEALYWTKRLLKAFPSDPDALRAEATLTKLLNDQEDARTNSS